MWLNLFAGYLVYRKIYAVFIIGCSGEKIIAKQHYYGICVRCVLLKHKLILIEIFQAMFFFQ